MMKKFYSLLACLLVSLPSVFCQMKVGNNTFFGNEWIDYSKNYFKIKIAEDGIYRITYSDLKNAGYFDENILKNQVALFNNGRQVPLFISNPGQAFTESDYVVFYGEKNRVSLDSFLFQDWKKELLNPTASMFTDTSIYYLSTIDASSALRYSLVDPNYQNNNLVAETHYIQTDNKSYFNTHYKPIILSSLNFRYSHMVSSEGFVNHIQSSSQDSVIVSELLVNDNFEASLSFNIATTNAFNNNKKLMFNDKEYGIDSSRLTKVGRPILKIKPSEILEKNTYKITGSASDQNHGVASYVFSYPRKFNFKNLAYTKANLSGGNKFMKLADFNPGFNYILDVKNFVAYKTRLVNTNLTELLVSGNLSKAMVFDKTIVEIKKIEKTRFKNTTSSEADYLIISSRKLYKTEGSSIDQISKYKEYRESVEGGNHKVEILFTDEIFDQFGYGIENHPMSFKNMAHFFKSKWPKLEYVLILGKGREYSETRTNQQNQSGSNDTYYVPSFGISPSDNLLVSSGVSFVPLFHIGRIAAKNMKEIGNYLEKIIAHDAIDFSEDHTWTKNIMHLGGGTLLSERNSIRSYLRRMEDIITKDQFGAKVNTYFKENAAEIQIANLPKIKADINEGQGIINFFGHAAVNSFDFTLDDPNNYENIDRTPFMFSLGCYSGNICTPGTGVSEKFVLFPKKGAYGFIAASGTAFLNTQGDFGLDFYSRLNKEAYGLPVGKLLSELYTGVANNINHKYLDLDQYARVCLYQQLVLHCDPAAVIPSFAKADYEIPYASIQTVPSLVTIDRDSFDFSFNIKNRQRALNDSMDVNIQHITPDNTIGNNITIRVKAPFFESSHKVRLRLAGLNAIGLNTIKVLIDSKFEIDEANENNNEIVNEFGEKDYRFFILSNKLKNVYPCDFATVGKEEDFILKVSSANAITEKRNYVIQIDTTELFNSPIFREQQFLNSDPAFSWKPDIPLLDSTAYYWRVSELEENVPPSWASSSFSYVGGEPNGWSQRHKFQFEKDDLFNIIPNYNSNFDFGNVVQLVKVTSVRYIDELNVPFTLINGGKYATMTPFRGNIDAMNVLIWAPNGIFLNKTKTDYNSLGHSNHIFPFDVGNEKGRKGVKDLLEAAPDSSYVFIFCYFVNSNSHYNYTKWPQDASSLGYTLYNTLEDYGAQKFNEFKSKGPVPYILIFKKGFGPVHESIGANIFDQVSFSVEVPFKGFFGKMSATVGPAKKWKEFYWKYSHPNLVTADTFVRSVVNIYKLDQNNNSSLHIYRSKGNVDLSSLDANKYPRIKIEYDGVDYYNFKPALTNFWGARYDGFADVYLTNVTESIPDTIDQGESITVEGNVGLAGVFDVDSVNLSVALVNSKNERLEEIIKLYNIGQAGGTKFKHVFNTSGINGLFQLIITANPDMGIAEKVFFNNTGIKSIFIKGDKINPLLDVTFDGIKIINKDIVSANPDILIKVKDENKYLLLENKSIVKIDLVNKDNGTVETINIQDARLKYEFSKNPENNFANINFKPTLQDGEYALRVQSFDASGNTSGTNEYVVDFVVINKKNIRNLVNYPNPFSNATQFIFELTGGIPDRLMIQIMTVNGKVVKELDIKSLGNLRIGMNRTQLSWNGTDEFGNKLANGIYLYKIFVPKEFDKTENFNSSEIGKLLIIR